MKLAARIGDRTRVVELAPGSAGFIEAIVDGRRYTISVAEPQERVFSLLVDGASHEAMVQVRSGVCRVRIGSSEFEVIPEEPGRPDRARAGGGAGAVVTAVMPGRVLRVMVSPGDAVEPRQGLVVLEAMKMENEIGAPRAGTVKAVRVAPGSTVERGDPLVVLD